MLYPKWTLPIADDVPLSRETSQIMNRLVHEFQTVIRMEIGKSLRLARPKRMHPAESVFSLQTWSDSNISVIGSYAVGPDKIVQRGSDSLSQKSTRSHQFTGNNNVESDETKSTPPSAATSNLKIATNDDTSTRNDCYESKDANMRHSDRRSAESGVIIDYILQSYM